MACLQMPLPINLFELLRSGRDADTALVDAELGLRLNYADLRDQVISVAEGLAAVGIRRGDRVALALPSGHSNVVALLAATIAGSAAPLNPAYTEEEFLFYLSDTKAKVMLLPAHGVEAARRAAEGRVRVLTVETQFSGAVALSGVQGRSTVTPPKPDDIALILHTSGSTGRPKRVRLSHANLIASAGNVACTYRLTSDDVSLCVMPLFHVHGLVASTLAPLATGGVVVIPRKFNPLSFWQTAHDHSVTWYSAAPTIHSLVIARARKSDWRRRQIGRLRFIRSCSAPLQPRVLSDLETVLGVPVLEAYGMTEAAHQIASNPLPPARRVPSSVGVGTNVRICVVDSQGRHLPLGNRGEVVISGANVVKAYDNQPDADTTSFIDGWFRTGDQGFLDSNGYLTLTGRLKELINRGGEKISPMEIDDVLLAHSAVTEAVCFGVPHQTWGEEVAAVVITSAPATERELLAFCKERLADYKHPKRIRIVDTIPRTPTGKIQRSVVAQLFRDADW